MLLHCASASRKPHQFQFQVICVCRNGQRTPPSQPVVTVVRSGHGKVKQNTGLLLEPRSSDTAGTFPLSKQAPPDEACNLFAP